MHHGIAGFELVVLTPAAHLSNIDQLDAFSEAVARFLDRAEGWPKSAPPVVQS